MIRKFLDSITPFVVKEVLIDSRHILLLEIFMGAQTLAWALIGGISGGWLNNFLSRHELQQDWLYLLGPIGSMQLGTSLFAWIRGRDWVKECIYRSVLARGYLAASGVVVWSAAVATMVSFEGVRMAPWLLIVLPFVCADAYSFYFNMKIRVVLDGRTSTKELLSRITRDRTVNYPVRYSSGRSSNRSGYGTECPLTRW